MVRSRVFHRWLPGMVLVVAAWAQPEIFIHNFHRVDDHILRGAQPGADGVRALAAAGVKTIVDLRPGNERESKEQTEAAAVGIHYVNVAMNGFHAPTDSQVARALETLNDPAAWPVFVHCKYGEDRTGTVIACYRVKHDGWSNEKALEEARQMGMHRWESGMRKYISAYSPAAAPPAP